MVLLLEIVSTGPCGTLVIVVPQAGTVIVHIFAGRGFEPGVRQINNKTKIAFRAPNNWLYKVVYLFDKCLNE